MVETTASQQYASTYVLKAKSWVISFGLMVGTLLFSILLGIGLFLTIDGQFLLLGSVAISGIASAIMFALYISSKRDPWGYVDIPNLSPRALGIGVIFGGILVAVQAGLTALFLSQGIGDAVGPLGSLVQQSDSVFLLWLIVVNVLLVAPAEELLYRNGIQKILATNHSASVAIIGSALIFSLPHLPNVIAGETIDVLAGLFGIFLNGIGYGIVYARWKRIDIPIVGHAVYNVGVFLFAHFQVF